MALLVLEAVHCAQKYMVFWYTLKLWFDWLRASRQMRRSCTQKLALCLNKRTELYWEMCLREKVCPKVAHLI